MTSNIPLPASDMGYNSNELPVGILKKPPLYTLVIICILYYYIFPFSRQIN